MSKLPAIETKRLYRHIADVLVKHIDAGEFPPGTTLPAERELAAQMHVSRTSIREALIALEVEGRVSVRVGTGVVVLPLGARSGSSQAAGTLSEMGWAQVGPLQLLEARRIVECEAAALAAKNATQADLTELRQICGAMKKAIIAHADHAPLDQRFHVKIAQASGNVAICILVAQLWEHRTSPVSEKFEEHFVDSTLFKATVSDHELIVRALVARDSRGARSAMKRHLDSVHRAYSSELA